MTRDSHRVHDDRDSLSDANIYAALWATAPFPRLPDGAPEGLKRLVVEVEDLKRIYGVHKARRRHNFQLLVERYVLQIRYGCQLTTCTTTTCFSCRKRVANGAPVRRYNSASARTLAIYMASQDDPESGLCNYTGAGPLYADTLKPPTLKLKLASDLRMSIRQKSVVESDRKHIQKAGLKNGAFLEDLPEIDGHLEKEEEEASEANSSETAELDVALLDDTITTDPRSFVQNLFGTVAFRMVEWLTPRRLASLVQAQHQDGVLVPPSTMSETQVQETGEKAFSSSSSAQNRARGSVEPGSGSKHDDKPERVEEESSSTPDLVGSSPSPTLVASKPQSTTISQDPRSEDVSYGTIPESRPRVNSIARTAVGSNRRKKSDTTESTTQKGILTKSQKSMETSNETSPATTNGAYVPKHKIPRQNLITSPKMHAISDLTHIHEIKETSTRPSVRSMEASTAENEDRSTKSPNGECASASPVTKTTEAPGESPRPARNVFLPQTMLFLSVPSIFFLCDIMQDHGMSEKHLFVPQSAATSWITAHEDKSFSLTHESWKQKDSYKSSKKWKIFIEQSFFDVLGKPDSLLESFRKEQFKLLDSQAIWYLMLRMTRVSPSLVFDSLWRATETLFRPPRQLEEAYEWAKHDRTAHFAQALSNDNAAQVISICFHALIAAAPLVSDPVQIANMSRIRSYGLAMLGRESSSMESVELYFAYEDAFANEPAFRLARRLFASIPTRRQFAELLNLQKSNRNGETAELDVLDLVIDSLKLVDLGPTPTIRFTDEERDLHEKMVPTLILDWARTVMLQEWKGSAEVPHDGPFGGALATMAAIYKHRKSLLLGDIHFRTEYFAQRLDPIVMPLEWLLNDQNRKTEHLLDHPYLFNPSTLVTYFRAINYSRMNQSYERAHTTGQLVSHFMSDGSLVTDKFKRDKLNERLRTATSEFMVLEIRRSNVLLDTFNAIWRREERELMRPLKVRLGEESGEQGLDSGGVQQEFFRLAIAEALNPDYGAFTIDSRTKMTWFQPGSPEPLWKFELIGMIISLAVYNGLNLPITFPKALYRKLLDEEVTELHHIADGWPDLTKGLTTLLEWDETYGSVEDIFACTYEFSVEVFGAPISREMNSSSPDWPQFSDLAHNTNPSDAPSVTKSNRNSYVSDYIRWLTDISIAPQFSAFKKGFFSCIDRKSLSLFDPETLQSVIEGIQEIDISPMRRATRYVGWDASHRSVKDFWSIVKRYDLPQKRKLLEFVTASDRVPVGGMRNLQFTLQRNGDDDGHLPTSYTCYGILLLPEYSSKDVLRERLAMALENSKGFGFA